MLAQHCEALGFPLVFPFVLEAKGLEGRENSYPCRQMHGVLPPPQSYSHQNTNLAIT